MGILKRILPPIIFALTLPVMAQVALNTLTSTGVVDFAVLNENFTNLAVGVNQSAKTNDAVFLNALTNAVQPPTTSGNTGSVSIVGRQFLINFPSPSAATGAVVSVNGEVGVVILNTDEIGEGATNLYFLHSRVTTNVTVTNLQNSTNDLSIRVIAIETGMLTRINWGTSVAAQVTSGQTGNWHAAFTGRLTLISWGTSVAAQITAGETGNWTAAYNAIGTNKFNEIWIGRPAQTGTNLTGLTAAYTSDITTTPIVWTSTTPITAHQTYIAGFHKSNAVGSVTMSVGGITIAATADGAASNWFATADTSLTNVTLSLNGDGVNLTLVSNVYVKAITNGSGYFADDIYVGDRIYSPNPIAYITDLNIVSQEVDAIQSNYLSLVSWGTSVASRTTSGDTNRWWQSITNEPAFTNWLITNAYVQTNTGNWDGTWKGYNTNEFANKTQVANATNAMIASQGNTNTGFDARIAANEGATNWLNTSKANTNKIMAANGVDYSITNAATAGYVVKFNPANSNAYFAADDDAAVSYGVTDTTAYRGDWGNAVSSRVDVIVTGKLALTGGTMSGALTTTAFDADSIILGTNASRTNWPDEWIVVSNQVQTDVDTLEASTNALNTRAGNLEIATNALNTRAGSLETATNALNTRAANLETATNNLNANKLSLSGGTMSGTLNMGAQNVTNAIYYGDGGGITNLTGAEPLWSAASNQVQTDIDNLESATSSLNANKLSLSGGTMTGQLKLGGNLDVNGYSATNFDSIIFRQTGPTALILFDPNDNPVSARYGFFRGTTTTNMYLQLNNTMGADDFDIKEQGGNILARFSAKDNNVQIPNLKVTTALNMAGNPITNVDYVQTTNRHAFYSRLSANQLIGTPDVWTQVQFDLVDENNGGSYNTNTWQFVAPRDGLYIINGGVSFRWLALNTYVELRILKSGQERGIVNNFVGSAVGHINLTLSYAGYATNGTIFQVEALAGATGNCVSAYSYFNGMVIH